MFVLAEFNILRPEPGLFFWSLLFFLIFWFLIAKFAFKPIANALVKRENHIQDALLDASKAKEELRRIQEENTRMMDEARVLRAELIKEAKLQSSKMIEDAKEKAKEDARAIVAQANVEIENQKKAALRDVKNQVTALALEVSELVMKKNLSEDKEQVQLVNELVDDIHLS
ncbi:F0F1 ATP synthase subunit B [Membranicola marinus]|uniref:ATP synthase subunit b n=1 Tax=Membranihabitans marinus TaxID=1227546 RepID=A0A953HX51_9BACT|nr:F0F1 ATP synthase subunit B [Membranihabitans marinus]MBY5958231.1 F0F1 ATP synthase subunit B [Membranihabitans marinus]